MIVKNSGVPLGEFAGLAGREVMGDGFWIGFALAIEVADFGTLRWCWDGTQNPI